PTPMATRRGYGQRQPPARGRASRAGAHRRGRLCRSQSRTVTIDCGPQFVPASAPELWAQAVAVHGCIRQPEGGPRATPFERDTQPVLDEGPQGDALGAGHVLRLSHERLWQVYGRLHTANRTTTAVLPYHCFAGGPHVLAAHLAGEQYEVRAT